MTTTVYIYGLFDKVNRCRYVGVTGDVKNRSLGHKKKHPKWAFRCFRKCDRKQGTKIEGQVIRAFKRLGQADKNRNTRERKEMLAARPPKFKHPLRALRISRGFFAYSVAERMGISENMLCFLETGRRPWTPKLVHLYLRTIGGIL